VFDFMTINLFTGHKFKSGAKNNLQAKRAKKIQMLYAEMSL